MSGEFKSETIRNTGQNVFLGIVFAFGGPFTLLALWLQVDEKGVGLGVVAFGLAFVVGSYFIVRSLFDYVRLESSGVTVRNAVSGSGFYAWDEIDHFEVSRSENLAGKAVWMVSQSGERVVLSGVKAERSFVSEGSSDSGMVDHLNSRLAEARALVHHRA